MRERGPILRSEAYGGFWILSRYPEVIKANRDWATFSSAEGVALPHNQLAPLMPPIEVDPPEHREWRRLLNPYFTPQAVACHEPAMRRIAGALITEFSEAGRTDIVRDFAWKFVPTALFELLLGVATSEMPRLGQLAKAIVYDNGTQRGAQAFAELSDWAVQFLQSRQEEPAHGDVVDALLGARIDGRELGPREMAAPLLLLVIAGQDTTSNSIGDITVRLISNPRLAELLRGDPSLIPAAVEEFLRDGSVSFGLARTATCAVEIGGQQIRAGERVFLLWGAANHDEQIFTQPWIFDPRRAPNPHLAFGAGPHRCMGAHFARLMLKVATEEIVTRLTDLQLEEGASLDYQPGLVRSLHSLKVRWSGGRSCPMGTSTPED
jgi:cytochrome P450